MPWSWMTRSYRRSLILPKKSRQARASKNCGPIPGKPGKATNSSTNGQRSMKGRTPAGLANQGVRREQPDSGRQSGAAGPVPVAAPWIRSLAPPGGQTSTNARKFIRPGSRGHGHRDQSVRERIGGLEPPARGRSDRPDCGTAGVSHRRYCHRSIRDQLRRCVTNMQRIQRAPPQDREDCRLDSLEGLEMTGRLVVLDHGPSAVCDLPAGSPTRPSQDTNITAPAGGLHLHSQKSEAGASGEVLGELK